MTVERHPNDNVPDLPHQYPAENLDFARSDPHSTHNQFLDTWLEYIHAHRSESDEVVRFAKSLSPDDYNLILAGYTLRLIVENNNSETDGLEETLLLPTQEHPLDSQR